MAEFQEGGIVSEIEPCPLGELGCIVPIDWQERLKRSQITVKIVLDPKKISEAILVEQRHSLAPTRRTTKCVRP